MWRGLAVSVVALAMTSGMTQGFQVSITNRCTYDIDLAHATPGSQQMSKLAVGQTVSRELGAVSPSNVFKVGSGGEATRTFQVDAVALSSAYALTFSCCG